MKPAITIRVAPDPVAMRRMIRNVLRTTLTASQVTRRNRQLSITLCIESINLQMIRIHVRQIQKGSTVDLASNRLPRPVIDAKARVLGILEPPRQETHVLPFLSHRLRQIQLKTLVAGVDALRTRLVHPRAIHEQ